MSIEVAVVELTNRCKIYEDFSRGNARGCLNCPLNKFHREFQELDYELFRKILKENDEMQNPIKVWELGWNGDPMLYSKIRDAVEELTSRKFVVNIVTNGYKFMEKIKPIKEFTKNVSFAFFLDSVDNDNDFLMAPGVLDDTFDAFEFLKSNGIRFSILTRVNAHNYNKLESILNIARKYGVPFVPFESFGHSMTDYQKRFATETIDRFRNNGIHKTITFENPSGNCTYLRNLRIFINSHGYLSFCHFISFLDTELVDLRTHTLEESIKMNEKIRNEFVSRKMGKLSAWVKPRITASPCSFCYKTFGGKEPW